VSPRLWKPDEKGADVSDGLHLTAEGYEAVYDALTDVITSKWPELDPEAMEMPTPQ
jgi:lysophospholipase L1-like esterase